MTDSASAKIETLLTPTRDLADWTAAFDGEALPDRTLTWAKHALLDWLGVTLAGAREPLVEILLADALEDGAQGAARLLGRPERVTPLQAALINGAASHALDYDDVNFAMHGHPSAPVLPALLALGERRRASGAELLSAFVAGYEVESALGAMVGERHYEDGWHNTATLGTFGAAAACAKLLGLNAEQTAVALGIAATQAAGLKAMFGTMCKPLHAGKAAASGLRAARLAARGFTSRADALECPQGFAATQAKGFQALPVRPDANAPYAVEANLFKYHAACYMTHSSIDAAAALRREHGFSARDVARVRLTVTPGHLKVCDIVAPRSGLEIKFSLRHTAALALAGEDTGAVETYSDANATRADLKALRERVEVQAKPLEKRTATEVVIELADGRSLFRTVDVGVPARDLPAQGERLARKFLSLAVPVIGEPKALRCLELCQALDELPNCHVLLENTA